MASEVKKTVSDLLKRKIENEILEEAIKDYDVMAGHSSVVVVANILDPELDRASSEKWDDDKVADFAARLAQMSKKSTG